MSLIEFDQDSARGFFSQEILKIWTADDRSRHGFKLESAILYSAANTDKQMNMNDDSEKVAGLLELEDDEPQIEKGGGRETGKAPGIDKYKETGLMPKAITECSLLNENGKPVCASDETIKIIGNFVEQIADDPQIIIDLAKKKTNCSTEKCVLQNKELQKFAGSSIAVIHSDLLQKYKTSGPTDVSLLSNFNIDDVLGQWSYYFNTYHYMFAMRDWRDYPSSLRDKPIADVFLDGYMTACCVINTDSIKGVGEHWMALFVDFRPLYKKYCRGLWNQEVKKSSAILKEQEKNSAESAFMRDRGDVINNNADPEADITIEFFNSSGNSPQREFYDWMEESEAAVEEIFRNKNDAASGKPVIKKILSEIGGGAPSIKKVNVTKIEHQFSRTECGVYSLLYIWFRLNFIPYKSFNENRILDYEMFHFRQHLFADGMENYSYEEFKKNITVKWE